MTEHDQPARLDPLPVPPTPPAHLDVLRARLADAAADAELLDLAFRTIDSPVGDLLLATSATGSCASPSPTRTSTPCSTTLGAAIGRRILSAPARWTPRPASSTTTSRVAARPSTSPSTYSSPPGSGGWCSNPARDPLRPHGVLQGDGSARRQSRSRARGRHGVLDEPAAHRGSVPPGRALGRLTRRLHRRVRGQTGAPRPGTRGRTAVILVH